jgi:plasmid stabilization system protein ParE
MGLKIIWLERSVLDLREIFDYYKIKASASISRKIVNSIRESVNILKTQTNVGSKEILLEDRALDYRSLVCGNYKIIYFIEKKTVYISTVFDCRRNPAQLTI